MKPSIATRERFMPDPAADPNDPASWAIKPASIPAFDPAKFFWALILIGCILVTASQLFVEFFNQQ